METQHGRGFKSEYFEGFTSYDAVRAADHPELERLGLTTTQIADRFQAFMDGRYNHDIFTVMEQPVPQMGLALCPCCRETWVDFWTVTNRITHQSRAFCSGTIHMARTHGLLEKGEHNAFALTPQLYHDHFASDNPSDYLLPRSVQPSP